jgi:hypothetical protein
MPDETKVEEKTTTLDDVLGAVTGVGKRVDALSNKVDSIDRRVTSLEKQPMLKTRVVHQERPAGTNGTGKVVQAQPAAKAAPKVVRREDPAAAGEDEAIKAGTWEKVVKTSQCYKIGITKTRARDAWKIKMYLRGQRRPATLVGFDGTQELIDFMQEVWPPISEGYFVEDKFAEEDTGKSDPPEFQYDDGVHFLVDWFRTAPNFRGHTYINVEGVYPLTE